MRNRVRSIVRWLAVLCILGGAAALASGCGSQGSDGAADGAQLYTLQGCVTCHGPRGEGTALAPTLADASARWTRAALIAYLKDPQAYAAKDPRLAAQGGRYSLAMPSYAMLAPQELERLVGFVLTSR